MQLSFLDAQRLLSGMRRVDQSDDTKLDGEVRLKIGININRMTPAIQTFEREVQKLQNRLANGAVNDPRLMAEIGDELQRMSDVKEVFKLKKIELKDLNLKENKKIKADVLALLAPIIKDFDNGESDGEE